MGFYLNKKSNKYPMKMTSAMFSKVGNTVFGGYKNFLVKQSTLNVVARAMSNNCLDASIGLSEEEAEIQSMAIDFATNELAPNQQKWDREGLFPVDVIKQSAYITIHNMVAWMVNKFGTDLYLVM